MSDIVLSGAALISLIVAVFKSEVLHTAKTVLSLNLIAVLAYAVFYIGLASPAQVWGTTYLTIRQSAASAGIELPNLGGYRPPYADRWAWYMDYTPPALGENALNGDTIKSNFTLNPMEGERIDIAVAKIIILFRFAVAVFIIVSLIKDGKWRNPLLYLYIPMVSMSTVAIWLPSISIAIGSVRLAGISLPLELITLGLWHNNRSDRDWLALPLSAFIFIYH